MEPRRNFVSGVLRTFYLTPFSDLPFRHSLRSSSGPPVRCPAPFTLTDWRRAFGGAARSFESLGRRHDVAEAAASLGVPDLAGAAARFHMLGDALRGGRAAGFGDLAPEVGFAHAEAVADGAFAGRFLLKHRHGDLPALEHLALTEVHHRTRRRGAEAVRRRGKAGEGDGAEKCLDRDRIDVPPRLAAFDAPLWCWIVRGLDLATVGQRYSSSLLSAGSLTEASNPVFETDSAIFFGSVLVGS